MSALLEVAGLTAGYGGVRVLHGIDLTVGENEIVAVLGANAPGRRPSCGPCRARSGPPGG